MDKYEYKVRADEIKSLIADGEYAEAVKIADTIDWRRVKSVMMLCTISDLYKINRRYEDSRDILLLAYERHAGGRLIVYSLCELSIKLEEYVQAIEYYKEFVQLAPKDTGRYILQYKLYEAQEVSLEERIAVLEEFKKKDYREKWAYELAYLYHRVGLESKCIEECDEMFLWFGEGKYVLKALELKKLHHPLTEEQQLRYEQIKRGDVIEPEFVTEGKAIKEEAEKETEEEDDDEYSLHENILTDPTQEIPSKELDDIQVKTVDVSQYNTLNLQKELAESMKEFLESHPAEDMPAEKAVVEAEKTKVFEVPEDITDEGTEEAEPEEIDEPEKAKEPMEEAVSAFQDTDEMQQITEEMLDRGRNEEMKPVSEEVFFGNTAEVNIEDVVSELVEKDVAASRQPASSLQPDLSPKAEEEAAPQKAPAAGVEVPEASPNPAVSNTGIIRTFHKPSGYDNILSQESDGQISLVVPEQEKIEKQITGQLSIEDIMTEWEKIKKENEQKMLKEIRERVHKQTDALFADFDESTKSGLLEELENAMVTAAIKEGRKKANLEQPKIVKVADLDRKEESQSRAEPVQKEEEQEKIKSGIEAAEKDAVELSDTEDEIDAEINEDILTDNDLEEPDDDIEEVDLETFEEETESEESELEETEDIIESEEESEEEEDAKGTDEAASRDMESSEEENKPETEAVVEAGEEADRVLQNEAPAEGRKKVKKKKMKTAEADEASEKEKAKEEPSGNSAADKDESAEIKQDSDNKYSIREMSQSEKEQFAPFIHHKKTRRQIVEAIDNISMASYTGNVVITGEEGTGTIALAKLLVKEIQLSDNNFSGKVAKISGSTMNKKDVGATLSKLTGGALIIENAAAMKKASVDAMVKELNQEGKGLIIILEDTKASMNDFLNRYKELSNIFNLRVDVEALDDQTLVKYARKYAHEQEYSIDELGVLALHTRIADMQTSDHEVTLAEIEELVDEAIYYADRKTPKHFLDVLFNKRYDDEDMIVLREKDFMHY